MEEKREFNQEQADLLFQNTKKAWLFNFVGVAGFVFLFLLGSIISASTGRYLWALLTIPGIILMALPSFLKIIKGASAKGLLDTGSVEIANVYENGYEEVDYAATNAANGGMAILKYGLMFFVSILLTPIALVTCTIKLGKISKAFGTKKPMIPLILDLSLIVVILIGGIVMGAAQKAGNEIVKDDYKGLNDEKIKILNDNYDYMLNKNHQSYQLGYQCDYDRETKEYTFAYTSDASDSLEYKGLEKGKTYTLNVETNVMKVDNVEMTAAYSGERLSLAQEQLKDKCVLAAIPYSRMLTDVDNVAMEKKDYNIRVKYTDSEMGVVLFNIGTTLYNGKPENSIWSYCVHNTFIHELKY